MKELSKGSLGASIYDRVAQDLVRGKLRPNQKITIRELAGALGTSSTPVRDAVQRLLQDQALEQRSVRDVRVPVLTVEQYLELSRIRAELEGLAAGCAAERAGARDVARLARITEQHEDAIAGGHATRAAGHNQRFHFALAEIAGMPVLLAILHRLWLRMGPLIAGYYAHAHQDMTQQHRAVIAACEAGDPAAARAAMRADIETAREGIIAYIGTLRT